MVESQISGQALEIIEELRNEIASLRETNQSNSIFFCKFVVK